jgi:hypothetical protein
VKRERERTIYSRRRENTTGKKKSAILEQLKKSFFLFRTMGTCTMQKHQDSQQTGAELQLTKMKRRCCNTKRNSIATQERRQTTMLAFPPLCGFAAFLSEAVRVRKTDRRGGRQ